MLSSLLLQCYEHHGFESQFISPISGAIISFVGQMYMDDIDLLVTDPDLENPEKVVSEAQDSLYGYGFTLKVM